MGPVYQTLTRSGHLYFENQPKAGCPCECQKKKAKRREERVKTIKPGKRRGGEAGERR